jgi:hypothetical protein
MAMSYLHCPTCRCAYNVAIRAVCPSCGVQPGTPQDPTEDVVAAAEQLARALARATPTELAAAEATLDARTSQFALPAAGASATPAAPPSILRAVRAALAPASPVVPAGSRAYQALLTTVVLALLTRLAPPPKSRRARIASRAFALLGR